MKNKKNKVTVILVAVLIALTALAAVLHFATRTEVAEGSLLVERDGVSVTLSLGELKLVRIRGQMRTNKGEVRDIDAQGIALADALRAAGFAPEDCAGVRVTADDGYSAVLTADEVLAPDNACLILQEEGGVRLMVFGDTGSKRNVSNVAGITVATGE